MCQLIWQQASGQRSQCRPSLPWLFNPIISTPNRGRGDRKGHRQRRTGMHGGRRGTSKPAVTRVLTTPVTEGAMAEQT